MASINGISLKGVNHHRGHEGESLLQASVCFLDKKVGFYSDGDWGGPHTLDVPSDLEKKFEDYYSFEYPDMKGLHILIWDLQTLIEDEKVFKDFAKKGCAILIRYKENIAYPKILYAGYSIEANVCTNQAFNEALKEQYPDVAILGIYRSLDDFNPKELACLTPTYTKFVDKGIEL